MSKPGPRIDDEYERAQRIVDSGRTHSETCWNFGSHHYDCARKYICRLEREIGELRAEREIDALRADRDESKMEAGVSNTMRPLTRLERVLINALGED